MIISNGALFLVNSSDIDSDGVLCIPDSVSIVKTNVGENLPDLRVLRFSDSVRKIENGAFSNNNNLVSVFFGEGIKDIAPNALQNCQNIETLQIPRSWVGEQPHKRLSSSNLKRIIRRDETGNYRIYDVNLINGTFYHKVHRHTIGTVSYSDIYPLVFNKNGICSKPTAHITVTKGGTNETIFEHAAFFVFLECRRNTLMNSFDAASQRFKITHSDEYYKHLKILDHAIRYTLYTTTNFTIPKRNEIKEFIKNIPEYAEYIDKLFIKYPKAVKNFYELDGLNISEVKKIIKPKQPNAEQVSTSCTRWLKSYPVTPNEMYAIVNAGYKNPGAFPYSWLSKTPKDKRSKLTQDLHSLLRQSAIKMYGPSGTKAPKQTLNKLAKNISQLIGQDINITYLGAGEFSKTYLMQIPGDKKYVWKIYHSDNSGQMLRDNMHDIELQNSFLLGGKKYAPNMRFREISTAGISNQRGEIYLIYPYTEGSPSKKELPKKRYAYAYSYRFIDRNPENLIGKTIIDVGSVYIDRKQWRMPRFVSKIMRTVLYNSWNDLGYLLNNYTSNQISLALSFLNDNISRKELDYKKIMEKIEFLKHRARIK